LSITITPVLTSIAVTPANATNQVGATQQFTATGTYSDSSTQDLSSQVTWASSSAGVATISASGLATAVSVGSSTISATLSGVTGNTLWTVQAPPLAITTTSFPTGTVNTAYSTTLTATGGVVPYSWSITNGSLPTGLVLNTNSGAITGTPTVAGTSNFTARVSDSGNPVQVATKPLSMTVLSVTTPPGTIGNTNEGTQTDSLWYNGAWINACRYPAASNLTVSAIRAKVVGVSGRYKCAIYTDSGGQPSRLLRTTAELSNPGSGWQTFGLASSVVLTNGQYYWLAIWSDSTGAQAYYSGTSGTLRWQQINYGNWPDPIATTGGANFNYCIYATP
jgi:hypothetical protein